MYGAGQMTTRSNTFFAPAFGDNTYDRREELSASRGFVVPTSYIEEEPPIASDQFEPYFGDNTYGRREELSLNHEGFVVPTSQEHAEWYYEEKPQVMDQFEPFFGDNTYSRRAQLSQSRTGQPRMAMPLSHDLVYGERKLAFGSTVITVPGAPSVSDRKGTQPPRKAGKTVSSTGVAGKMNTPFEADFIYGEPVLAWDSGNRSKMVKPLPAEEVSTGVVKPVEFAKRTEPVKMYGAQRTNERYSPDFGDNTYDRREELSTTKSSKGAVVPTSKEQSQWYYEENPQATDQFEPYFGDNTYPRRAELSKQ
jgi:hypothetical protein